MAKGRTVEAIDREIAECKEELTNVKEERPKYIQES